MLQIPVAKVAVLAATFAFDRPYTYKIPQPLTDTLRPGCRVMVPFSRGNRPCEGMVLALDQAQDDPKLKPITRQLDPEPILSPELIRLAIWMHDRFFCTIYDALHAILPAGVWYRVSTVYCAAPELDTDAALTLCGRSKQRRLALETVLAHGGRCPLETLQTAFGDKDPASTLHWLVEQKLLTVEGAEKRVVRDKQLEYASLAVSLEEAQEEIRRRRRAPHQVAILELLCTIGRASADEVCQFTGAPKSSMKTLVRQKLVHIDTEPYFRRPTHYTGQPKPIPALTAAQAEVFSGLQALLRSPDAQAALLFRQAQELLEHDGCLCAAQILLRAENQPLLGRRPGDHAGLIGRGQIRLLPEGRFQFIREAGRDRPVRLLKSGQLHAGDQKLAAADRAVRLKAEVPGNDSAGVKPLVFEPHGGERIPVAGHILIRCLIRGLQNADLDAGLIRDVPGWIGRSKNERILADLVFIRRIGEAAVRMQLDCAALWFLDKLIRQLLILLICG